MAAIASIEVKVARIIVRGWLALLGWMLVSICALTIFKIDVPAVGDPDEALALFNYFLLWPIVLVEELLFRFPLMLVIWGIFNRRLLAPTALGLSFLFGYAHGGVVHVAIQGVGGVILCVVFLYGGALYRRPLAGLACSTLTHGLYDTTLFLMIRLGDMLHQ